jgi:hypothetical protein
MSVIVIVATLLVVALLGLLYLQTMYAAFLDCPSGVVQLQIVPRCLP